LIKPIKVWSYTTEYEIHKAKILSVVDKVFKSGNLILGNEVKNFEKNFSIYNGCKYGIGVNSGTDAILISLLSLGLKKDDEVITVANTAVPTVSAIVSSGAKPVFIDINEKDFLINTSEIEKKITKKTKVIIPVNLYGQSVNLDEIIKISKKYKIKILQDCAQCTGSKYKNKMVGSFGDISAFSFYPTKNLGAYGDAGMILTNSKSIYEKCLMLRKYGMKKIYYSEIHGINSRLDEIQAAILNFKLKKLDLDVLKRRLIAQMYNKKIINRNLLLPTENDKCFHSYYAYVVRTQKRTKVLNFLKKNDVLCNISYQFPIHLMKAYKYLGYKRGDLPITEKLCNEIFSLPLYPHLSLKDQKKIIKLLNEFI
jgi:aminotransferase EvaB